MYVFLIYLCKRSEFVKYVFKEIDALFKQTTLERNMDGQNSVWMDIWTGGCVGVWVCGWVGGWVGG